MVLRGLLVAHSDLKPMPPPWVDRNFMNPGVGYDVGNRLSVSGDLAAHEAAVDYIRSAFASVR